MKKAREFKARKGSMFGDEKAQVYGEFLWELKDENEFLTPALVVKKAKAKDSPIHDYFEWNDNDAGEKYRLWQARQLMRSIEVFISKDDEETIEAFHNITVKEVDSEDDDKRRYVSVDDIQKNPEYLEMIVENAQNEAKGWYTKYNRYKKLRAFKPMRPIFEGIKEATRQLSA